jgi:hypothetical protein
MYLLQPSPGGLFFAQINSQTITDQKVNKKTADLT